MADLNSSQSAPRGKSWRRERELREQRLRERRGDPAGEAIVAADAAGGSTIVDETGGSTVVDAAGGSTIASSGEPSADGGDAGCGDSQVEVGTAGRRASPTESVNKSASSTSMTQGIGGSSHLTDNSAAVDDNRTASRRSYNSSMLGNSGCNRVKQTASADNDGKQHQKSMDVNGSNTAAEETAESSPPEWEQAAERLARETSGDEAVVAAYIAALQERKAVKSTLREANVAAAESRDDEPLNTAALDSSLKRNTAFVRKLRCFSEQQTAVVLRDMMTLNLTKYISEAASALVEVKLKMTDVPSAVLVCSRLHQRYGEFSTHLLENWQRALMVRRSGSEEKPLNASKLRVDLRLYAELVSVRAVARREGLQTLGGALTALSALDKADHCYSGVLISFCRFSGEEYAGLVASDVRQAAERLGRPLPATSDVVPAEKQRNVRQLFVDYLSGLWRHLLREHQQLLQVRAANRHALQTRGELSAERQERQRQVEATHGRLLAAAQQLAELLGEPLSQLPEDAEEQAEQQLLLQATADGVLAADGAAAVWEDDEQRCFYTSLTDLRASLPSILYSDSQTTGPTAPDETCSPEEMDDIPEDVSDEHLREPLEDDPAEPAETGSAVGPAAGSAGRVLMDAFLTSLPTRISRTLVDQAAVQFCLNLNTRSNRRRLVRALFIVPRTRIDLLPFYARLVATLHPCMPELATELSRMLKADFKFHVRKKDQVNVETKLKVMRFIGELVKFGVYGRNEALWCVRMLLNDFTHHHVEMTCALLESCGRLLYRTVESHVRTKLYLEQVMRKRAAMAMDGRYVNMIDNMYYTIVPSEGSATSSLPVRPPRPPLHNYICKLVYEDLSKTTADRVTRQLRKLDWGDATTADYCVKCLSSVWRVRYLHIRCLAGVVAALSQYQESVASRVVDHVLEDVRLGMEAGTDTQHNQRRVCVMRYVGELYNYRLLDTAVVFRVLYSLIAFGVSVDVDAPSAVDPPGGSETRLRLLLLLLDTCGPYLTSGSARRQLDQYLVPLQRYFWLRRVWCELQQVEFPIRLQHQYRDALTSLRPGLQIHDSLQDASDAVDRLQKELMKQVVLPAAQQSSTLSVIAEEAPASSGTTGGHADEDADLSEPVPLSEEDDEEESVEELTDDSAPQPVSSEEAPPDLAPRLIACPEDEEFLAAFDRMMYDSLTDRSRETVKPQMELTTPLTSFGTQRKSYGQLQAELETREQQEQGVSLTVMLRRGARQLQRQVLVPCDSELAVSLRSRAQAEREERERVKRLTLDINERQEMEEMEELLNSSPVRPFNVNRERRARYNHAKGAPDADLIFGSRRVGHR